MPPAATPSPGGSASGVYQRMVSSLPFPVQRVKEVHPTQDGSKWEFQWTYAVPPNR